MLTNDEAIELYGDVELKFSSYYKYVFMFVGFAEDGARICVTYGGDADDIYRYDVDADETLKFEDPDNWRTSSIMKEGEEIFQTDSAW